MVQQIITPATYGGTRRGLVSFLFLLALLLNTACGSDDGTVDYDRDFTQVSYSVKPAFDLQQLYTVRAVYTDFKGIKHDVVIENTTEWAYKEKEAGDHPISCQVIATAKSPEEYGTLDRSLYSFTWEYSIYWYKQNGGAHSTRPEPQGRAVKGEEVAAYMAENPVITLFNFSKP